MSGAGAALAPGPQRGAEAGGGRQGAPAQEKCDKENAERTITQATDSCFSRGEMQDQPVWGNCSDDELIQTQPQRLPQLPTCSEEPSEEETSKIKNGHTSLSNGNGIHHGAKHVSADNRRLSAPVSHKMHRKIQSSLSVNSDISKKSKVNAVFSQKTGSSPEVNFRIRDIPTGPLNKVSSESVQIAVSTVSWPACSVNSSPSAILSWAKLPVASAPQKPAAVAVETKWGMTVTAHVTWIVASWMLVVNHRTVWKSVWNAVEFVFLHSTVNPNATITFSRSQEPAGCKGFGAQPQPSPARRQALSEAGTAPARSSPSRDTSVTVSAGATPTAPKLPDVNTRTSLASPERWLRGLVPLFVCYLCPPSLTSGLRSAVWWPGRNPAPWPSFDMFPPRGMANAR
ncbi:myoD family inhibitor domain-containing protein isoform X7 [Canis lupus familiaris]|uniref:myoD family inhibitor domain-containing protein isoform X7 n=2 Tax=Canis lupus familiaris TaxID=9615 RepID=UPI0018F2CCBE|nr:myoD family inhibitor domain-containing protein isoform X7 [Canis lupus familiaris]